MSNSKDPISKFVRPHFRLPYHEIEQRKHAITRYEEKMKSSISANHVEFSETKFGGAIIGISSLLGFFIVISLIGLIIENPRLLIIIIPGILFLIVYGPWGNKDEEKCKHGIKNGGVKGACSKCIEEFRRDLTDYESHLTYSRELEKKYKFASGIFNSEMRRLKKILSSDIHVLRKMQPSQFEEYVMDLFRDQGFEVKQTPLSRDEGYDGMATKDGISFLIECKRFAEENKVGRRDVQIFYSAISTRNLKKGLFITTSSFTQEAMDFSKSAFVNSGIQIDLIDNKKLMNIIHRVYQSNFDGIFIAACLECGEKVKFDIKRRDDSIIRCSKGHRVEKTIELEDVLL